jgi:hypothetical protein
MSLPYPPPPLLHSHSSKKSRIERGRHIPTSFTCPCCHKRLKGARHVPIPYLASKCILQEMEGEVYVSTPFLHSHAFKKIRRNRHVLIPRFYILVF